MGACRGRGPHAAGAGRGPPCMAGTRARTRLCPGRGSKADLRTGAGSVTFILHKLMTYLLAALQTQQGCFLALMISQPRSLVRWLCLCSNCMCVWLGGELGQVVLGN